jgi:dTDP-4-dehydrorhamnose 3,5-epimerase
LKFSQLELSGAFLIEPEYRSDQRGCFARVFCRDEFVGHDLDCGIAQCNISFNPLKATLRGMHYQVVPHQEVKLVRCTMGAVFDVIIDLRSESNTFRRWLGVELSAENRRMLYVPKGFAHGYITLRENSEVFYQVSESYSPLDERGVRFDDPAFDIRWPLAPAIMSEKDRTHPLSSV